MDGGGTAPPFIQATFLLFVLASIALAFRGCGNAESKVSATLVEGVEVQLSGYCVVRALF